MRRFKDGETITIEPWRAKAFPVIGPLLWTAPPLKNSSGGLRFCEYRRYSGCKHNSCLYEDAENPWMQHPVSARRLCCRVQNSSAMLFVSAKVSSGKTSAAE